MTAVHELMRPSVSLLKGAHVLCRSVLVTGAAGVNAGERERNFIDFTRHRIGQHEASLALPFCPSHAQELKEITFFFFSFFNNTATRYFRSEAALASTDFAPADQRANFI